MKKALLLLSILVLLLPAACGKAVPAAETPAPTETPAPAETPPVEATSGPTEAPELVPGAAETEELRLTVTEADGYGCAFTLENLGTRPYNPLPMSEAEGPYALLRRGAGEDWERLEPIRRSPDGYTRGLNKGETWTGAWDWSYTYGVLPAGDYALLLRGTLGRGVAKEAVYLLGTFTLSGAEPVVPGPLTLSEMPDEVENSLDRRSDHRWVQTLSPSESRWLAETDYSLFRLENGTLEYIPPAYRLPEALNDGKSLLYGWSATYDVDLAAQYGELPAGTYVLRRRFLRLTEEELDAGVEQTRNWRLIPEDRVTYGDTVFTLRGDLPEVPWEVDPVDERTPPYCGEESTALISTAGSVITAERADLRLENLTPLPGYNLGVVSDYSYLYFQYRGEWYPMAQQRRISHGLMARFLAPGAAGELSFDFTARYGTLEPGEYRLVLSCIVEPYSEDAGFVVCQFRINEDGSGTWEGLEEAESLVQLYGKQRLALYDLPLEGDWFYVPGPTWSRDPCVESWVLERHGDRLTVTVYRDRDYAQALALLGSNPEVEIVKKETPFTTPSPVRKWNTGAGTLSARLLEQDSPVLDPEGAWILSLTWEGEETAELLPDAMGPVYLEEYDPAGEEWRRLPMIRSIGKLDFGWGFTVPLEPGKTVNVYLATLAWYKAELSREKQYRFVLNVDGLGWFACPLPLGRYEKAATEEEIEALGQDYPLMADYIPLTDGSLLGKPLEYCFSRLVENENYDFFYAEAEYLGKGPKSENTIHKALRFRVRDILCGAVEALPWEYLEEDRSSVICYSAAEDSWAPDIQTLPDFREGDRYILCLALPKTEQYAWRDYPNAIFLLGNGEVYYVTEGDLIMPTQSFREEYAGYARKTFKRLLRELYEEAVSRQEDKNGSVRGEMA